jgi:hypothetical protein
VYTEFRHIDRQPLCGESVVISDPIAALVRTWHSTPGILLDVQRLASKAYIYIQDV